MSDENGKVVARIVRCPECGKSAEYSSRNSFRPFCSERCRLIDLGEWAEGNYKVPTAPHEMTPEELDLLEAELAKADREGESGRDEES